MCDGALTDNDVTHFEKETRGATFREDIQEGDDFVGDSGIAGVARVLRKTDDSAHSVYLCKIQALKKDGASGRFFIAYSWSSKVSALKPFDDRRSTVSYNTINLGDDIEMRRYLDADFDSQYIFFECKLPGSVGSKKKNLIVQGELYDRFVGTDWDYRRSILVNTTRTLIPHLGCGNEVSIPDIRNEVAMPSGEGPPKRLRDWD